MAFAPNNQGLAGGAATAYEADAQMHQSFTQSLPAARSPIDIGW